MVAKRARRSMLPTGTVTFLFTDIEGSTPLWERSPAAMRSALAEHYRSLEIAVESHGGSVVKTMGDGIMAVFDAASDALAACVAAQRVLQQPTVEGAAVNASDVPTLPLRVRMGLHTGEAETRGGDYFGSPLNVAARIMGVAHGGQVLLSSVTAEIVRGQLPPGVSLKSVGACTLKGVSEPVHLEQLVAQDLRADFPPPSGAGPTEDTLPSPLTSFVGRKQQVRDCQTLLRRTRLLTLTGLGGSGKTRLAIEIARRSRAAWTDGVYFVDLTPVTAVQHVLTAVATAVGLQEDPSRPLIESLCSQLSARRALLVLDNCEQVLRGCAELLVPLLARSGAIKVLATSREPLALAGEQIHSVPPLDVAAGAGRGGEASEAAQLFIARAHLANARVATTGAALQRIEAICRRLDGIPLAIELAAARCRVLSLEEIDARLANRFSLLKAHSATGSRHQTLRDVIDWTYSQLAPEDQQALRRLSVFAGGWTLDAAAEVVGCDPYETIDRLERLVDKSLVLIDAGASAGTRYRMLETVREYAFEQLDRVAEVTETKARHLACVMKVVDPNRLTRGTGLSDALREIAVEFDNLVAAHDWCDVEPGHADEGLDLANGLGTFLRERALPRTGRAILTRALERPGARQGEARARALVALGHCESDLGDYEIARRYYTEALDAARNAGNEPLTVVALRNIGGALGEMDDIADARRVTEESLRLARELGLHYDVGAALTNLGEFCRTEQRPGDASPYYEEAYRLFLQHGLDTTNCLLDLSIVANEAMQFLRACGYLRQAAKETRRRNSRYHLCWLPHHTAAVAGAMGDFAFAARMWGAAASARSATGLVLQRPDVPYFESRIERSRRALGDEEFERAYQAGRALSVDEAASEIEAWLARSPEPESPRSDAT